MPAVTTITTLLLCFPNLMVCFQIRVNTLFELFRTVNVKDTVELTL
jgi:hypothetical protein